jgi:hypothetical protein
MRAILGYSERVCLTVILAIDEDLTIVEKFADDNCWQSNDMGPQPRSITHGEHIQE